MARRELRSTHPLAMPDVQALLSRLGAAYPDVSVDDGPWSMEARGTVDRLPELPAIRRLQLTDFTVDGRLGDWTTADVDCEAVLERGGARIGDRDVVILNLPFVTAEGLPAGEAPHRATVEVRRGRPAFGLFLVRSPDQVADTWQPAFVRHLVERVGLPLDVTVNGHDYHVAGRDGCAVWTTGALGPHGASPRGFRVDWPAASHRERLTRITEVMHALALPAPPRPSWTATGLSRPPGRGYARVRETGLPAASHDVSLDFDMWALEHLDAVTRALGPDWVVSTHLGGGMIDDGDVELYLRSGPDGHWVHLSTDSDALSARVGALLGLDWCAAEP